MADQPQYYRITDSLESLNVRIRLRKVRQEETTGEVSCNCLLPAEHPSRWMYPRRCKPQPTAVRCTTKACVRRLAREHCLTVHGYKQVYPDLRPTSTIKTKHNLRRVWAIPPRCRSVSNPPPRRGKHTRFSGDRSTPARREPPSAALNQKERTAKATARSPARSFPETKPTSASNGRKRFSVPTIS